ncbi:IclR family transcriptional regulator [Pusillimonas sp.]|uniref:IclR family transcriptional regulator n=1 Tax=Pusillimonas sp. TaxID=3040095 RepID=UPI0029AF2BB5|nr:IclR family transcriptional regulator [Pusillimonas sp.]MDX3893083.1 IclR family transcriptional regulator [Pusillimonas sp.]
MSEQDAAKGLVTPVMRGMRLLRYIAEGGNTGNLSEVGRLIDVNRVTVMRLLATLEHEGLIERLPQGGHRVGMAFLTLAASALGSVDLLGEGRHRVERLSRELGVSAYMVVLEGYHVVYVHREMPEGGLVSHIRVGSRVPAFLTAPGRAMLAQLDDGEVKRLWSAWRDGESDKQSVARMDAAEFARQLEEDGGKGHAWSFSGYEAGINACAAAVKAGGGRPVAALSVVAPQPLFDADPGLRERMQRGVVQAARDLSRVAGG